MEAIHDINNNNKNNRDLMKRLDKRSVDAKRQRQHQSSSLQQTKYIKFVQDKELLSSTGS